MRIDGLSYKRSLVGNDWKFLIVVGIVAIIGTALSRTLLQTRPVLPTGRGANMAAFSLFAVLCFAYFIISVAISFDGGGLLESFIILFGVVFGLYSSICAYISHGLGGGNPQSSLQCSVVGTSFPVLDIPVFDVIMTSAVIALALSIVSIGLGRLLHKQIPTK